MAYAISEIIEGFRNYDGRYRRELVNAAIEQKEAITPRLIRILETVIADPEPYREDDGRFDHIYAAMLLGHFRAAEAHGIIADVFSLPESLIDDLFGDIAVSDLPSLLVLTCNNDLDRIRAMALDKEASDHCRSSALHAMAYAVVLDMVPRKEVLAFYQTLFTEDQAGEGSDFWGLLALHAASLFPGEILDTIDRAFESGLIDPLMASRKDIDYFINQGEAGCLARVRKAFEKKAIEDIHAHMSWWACFNEDGSGPPPKDRKKKKNKAKKKRQMAKASKRKNRR